jgi:hypothetical protein
LSGTDWYKLIRNLRRRGLSFLEVNSEDLYDKDKVNDICNVYYNRTTSRCKIIYYEFDTRWHKRLREISFSPREIEPMKCVLTFRKIAKSFNELVPYEPHKYYTNGVYTYYKKAYSGYVTVLDMNSAYLWALRQPLADWTTKTEIQPADIFKQEYDYYCFENDIHCEMFYKKDIKRMSGAILWADVKVYGFKAKLYYQQTTLELYRLKCEVNKERYKNVANITVGCMHKRSGKQNNTTMAASLYAWFAYYIDNLVDNFEKKGYNVIMVTTDSIKIKGKYNPEDNLVKLGKGLGEFKVEYEGDARYISTGHYEENQIKWKGKPLYMREGFTACQFIDNIKKERKIYEKYAIE